MLRALALGIAVTLALLPAQTATAQPVTPTIASLQLINSERNRAGLPPLAVDPALSAVAAAHARDMVQGGYFGHVSPRTGTPAARVRRAGVAFEAVGENLARHRTPGEAHQLLMGSAPHRATLLSARYRSVGVAAVTDGYGWVTIVQVFLEPPASAPTQYSGEPGQPGAPVPAQPRAGAPMVVAGAR